MAEQKLALTGLLDTVAIKVGKLAGADYILTGDITLSGKIYIINMKIIECESGKIIFTDFIRTRNLSLGAKKLILNFLYPQKEEKMSFIFPMVMISSLILFGIFVYLLF